MWADTIDLAIGRWQLGVRVDTPRTSSRLRALFRTYDSADGEALPSNFSIRTPTGRLRKKPGRLYRGGAPVVESTDLDHLTHELVRRLSELQTIEAPVVDVDVRVFRLGDRAVVTDVIHPALTDNERLVSAGIREITTAAAWIDTSTAEVVVPDPLPDLDWSAADVAPATWRSERIPIRRVFGVAGIDDTPDIAILWARARSNRHLWLDLLLRMRAGGRLRRLPQDWEDMHDAVLEDLTST